MAKKKDKVDETVDVNSEELVATESPVVPATPIQDVDEGWTNYVLSLLWESEKSDNRPKCVGLRRVAKVLGYNVYNQYTNIFSSAVDFASVKVTLEFYDPIFRTINKTVEACGESGKHNTDYPYCNSPLATAETKAEARAYKKLLSLNILTDDEYSRVAGNSSPAVPMTNKEIANDTIQVEQLTFIGVLCQRLNLSVHDVGQSVLGVKCSIDGLTKDEGIKVLESLDQWQRDSSLIPTTIPPFDKNWRSK